MNGLPAATTERVHSLTVRPADLDGPDNAVVGRLVVVQQNEAAREIKRLWVDPRARGLRTGSALMDAALTRRDLPIRLTVWDWRDDPVRLYRSRGFDLVESWDDRPRLLCMQLAPRRPADLDE